MALFKHVKVLKRVKKNQQKKQGQAVKALLLLSGGFDSPVAGWLLKNNFENLTIHALHFTAVPFTDGKALEKSVKLCKLLGFKKLFIANLALIQKAILEKAPEAWLTILSRRAMLKIASKLAMDNDYKFLITGDSLGQVASQTLRNLVVINESSKVLVLRPLLFFNKQEIIELSKKAGCYEISKIKAMDCGLTPKKPVLKASLEKALQFEKVYNAETVVKNVLSKIEVKNF